MTSSDIVIAFNQAITEQDVDKLAALMTNDHTFIDSAGQKFEGKEKAVEIWQGFFAAFPDYQNHFEKLVEKDGLVIATGKSTCSNEPALDGSALWTVMQRDEQVSEWRVYEDTAANRLLLQL